MARPSKTAKPPRLWSTMVGMRPLGLRAVYQGSFCVFLEMLTAWTV